jgi:hypothetical protein
MKITSTKGTIEIKTATEAREWFDAMQPAYADIDGIQVAAHFIGVGTYTLSNGDASLPLGEHNDLGDLAAAVAQCILAGDADWSGWEVSAF